MMQVVDRRSQMGSSSTTSAVTVTSPITSPKKASQIHHSPRPPLPVESGTNGGIWANSIEDNALSRTQQFIIETHKHPIRFKLSDTPISAEVPYPPINDDKLAAEERASEKGKKAAPVSRDGTLGSTPMVYTSTMEETNSSPRPSSSTFGTSKDLFPHRISLHPPKEANERGVGLINKGNTCYMNSTLQALLHLPPLSHALLTFDESQLYGRMGATPAHKFDALGEMVTLAERVLTKRGGGAPTAPLSFITNLKSYARTLSKFRQEDAHEFLRFLMEAMQYCCLARAPKAMKPNDALRETTVMHKIFGGKLRSRVQCQRCNYNSDTFDPILDLSLDLRKSSSVTEALERFTSTDVLTGSEKYKCEKCKKAVDATKSFTIHEPPLVLTIHLKRFTLSGQKISRQISYSDSLVLSKAMLSEGLSPQHYKLRSIVHHHGNTPNSGHYVASVRGNGSNRWYEMNDSSVYPTRGQPINMHDAYILFYVRDPGQALSNVVRSEPTSYVNGHNNGKKRRPSEATEADTRPAKRRDEAVGGSPLREKMKGRDGSSPLGPVKSSINPAHFYGSPSTATTSATAAKATPMFRNLDNADSEEDDVGEAIEAQSSHVTKLASASPMSVTSRAKKRKQQHRDSLRLGIRAGNEKSTASLIGSPFKVGRDDLHSTPFHLRMKDRQGKRFH